MTPQLILIAGPYRSGAQGDPERVALNLKRLEQTALRVYQPGHMPMIGEWVALPLSAAAGSPPSRGTQIDFTSPPSIRNVEPVIQ